MTIEKVALIFRNHYEPPLTTSNVVFISLFLVALWICYFPDSLKQVAGNLTHPHLQLSNGGTPNSWMVYNPTKKLMVTIVILIVVNNGD